MSRFHISTISEMTHIANATRLPSNPKKPKETGTPDSKRNAGNTINRIATVSATLIKNLPFPLLVAAFHDVLHKHRGALPKPITLCNSYPRTRGKREIEAA